MAADHFSISKCVVVIPVYNNRNTVRRVVLRCLQVHDSVMVIDDGCSDGSIEEVEDLDVFVVRHTINRGKGAAIISAAKAASLIGMTHIITIDADGQHNPDDIKKFIPFLRQDSLSIVIGKRNFTCSAAPLLSRFGRKFSNFWFRLQTGIPVEDTQSGFRAYPLAIFDVLRFKQKRYAFELEILVKASWSGVLLREVDIDVYYPHRDDRVSHFRFFKDNFQISLLNVAFTLRSILPVRHRRYFNKQPKEGSISLLSPIRSLRLLLDNDGSAFRLAASGALGVFLGALPLLFIHSLAILLAASFFRLNKILALATSQLCMPPFMPALCIEAGYFYRHGQFLTEISMRTLGQQAMERIYDWLLGSLIVAPAMAAAVGGGLYLLAIVTKRRLHEGN